MGANSLPKTVILQRRGCDLNPGPSAPESSTRTTRLPSHQKRRLSLLFLAAAPWCLPLHSRWSRWVQLTHDPVRTGIRVLDTTGLQYLYDMEAHVNIAYRIFANSCVNGRIGADIFFRNYSQEVLHSVVTHHRLIDSMMPLFWAIFVILCTFSREHKPTFPEKNLK